MARLTVRLVLVGRHRQYVSVSGGPRRATHDGQPGRAEPADRHGSRSAECAPARPRPQRGVRVKHSLHRRWSDAPTFYTVVAMLVAVAAAIVLVPGAPL